MLKIGMVGVNVPFPFGLCTSLLFPSLFIFSSLSIFSFCFFLLKFSNASNFPMFFMLVFFFPNYHHCCKQRRKNKFLSFLFFALFEIFLGCFFVAKKENKVFLVVFATQGEQFFSSFVTSKRTWSSHPSPFFWIFFVIVAKGASSSLSLFNYHCLLPKDLETFLYKKCSIVERARFFGNDAHSSSKWRIIFS